jgi:hypothetical protein
VRLVHEAEDKLKKGAEADLQASKDKYEADKKEKEDELKA